MKSALLIRLLESWPLQVILRLDDGQEVCLTLTERFQLVIGGKEADATALRTGTILDVPCKDIEDRLLRRAVVVREENGG